MYLPTSQSGTHRRDEPGAEVLQLRLVDGGGIERRLVDAEVGILLLEELLCTATECHRAAVGGPGEGFGTIERLFPQVQKLVGGTGSKVEDPELALQEGTLGETDVAIEDHSLAVG